MCDKCGWIGKHNNLLRSEYEYKCHKRTKIIDEFLK
jgi:hypothetical protein